MQRWVADLHVHSLLSPCAEIEMTPRHIVKRASENGINLVAITDHNVSGNVKAAIVAGQSYGVTVWPGVEVESKEGGHIVVIFDSLRKLKSFQDVLDENMTELKNNPDKFGGQFVVDEEDEFVREEERFLLAPVNIAADDIAALADELGGVAIVAHIDKPAYSLLNYLGFIAPGSGFVAAEVSRNSLLELADKKMHRLVGGLTYITNSDAHRMDEFLSGPRNHIYMKEATIKEFKLALSGAEGRYVEAGHME